MAVATDDPVFVMHGARVAVAGGMLHIEEQVKALELAVVENTGLAFDLAKTLVESACKTIITERGGTFDKDDEMSKLFKAASLTVPFLPPLLASDAAARKSLQQTLSGLNTAMQGVCEMRNAFGSRLMEVMDLARLWKASKRYSWRRPQMPSLAFSIGFTVRTLRGRSR